MPELRGLGAAMKAIRLKCLDCSCGNVVEVRECVIPKCPLYEWRFGKNPHPGRKGPKNPFGRNRVEVTDSE